MAQNQSVDGNLSSEEYIYIYIYIYPSWPLGFVFSELPLVCCLDYWILFQFPFGRPFSAVRDGLFLYTTVPFFRFGPMGTCSTAIRETTSSY